MQLKVAFLDCKTHGDCIVVTFEEDGQPACIVIDGGDGTKSAAALRKYLKQEKIERVDLMVGTHIDQDHIYGLYFFVRDELKKKNAGKAYIDVKEFWGPQPSADMAVDVQPTVFVDVKTPDDAEALQNYMIQSVEQNDNLFKLLGQMGTRIRHPALDSPVANPFSNVAIDLLGPDTQIPADTIKKKALGQTTRGSVGRDIRELEDLILAIDDNRKVMAAEANRNANNQSIVFRMTPAVGSKTAKKWSFLFSGDAEEEAWDEMTGDDAIKKRLRAQVLKVPHHGSHQNGITTAGAKAVKPKYSIIMTGQKHGLPDEETLSLLQVEQKCDILCSQHNSSSSHPSACYKVAKSKCPAKNNPQTVCFTLDTKTGKCVITPAKRTCKKKW